MHVCIFHMYISRNHPRLAARPQSKPFMHRQEGPLQVARESACVCVCACVCERDSVCECVRESERL